MYRIVFWKWSNSRRENLDGYNAWDYLSGSPGEFSTKAEAQSWLRSHHKGPDRYKVKALFKVVKGRSNPGNLLFRTRAAALKYAREHGAKRFSIRKVKAGR